MGLGGAYRLHTGARMGVVAKGRPRLTPRWAVGRMLARPLSLDHLTQSAPKGLRERIIERLERVVYLSPPPPSEQVTHPAHHHRHSHHASVSLQFWSAGHGRLAQAVHAMASPVFPARNRPATYAQHTSTLRSNTTQIARYLSLIHRNRTQRLTAGRALSGLGLGHGPAVGDTSLLRVPSRHNQHSTAWTELGAASPVPQWITRLMQSPTRTMRRLALILARRDLRLQGGARSMPGGLAQAQDLALGSVQGPESVRLSHRSTRRLTPRRDQLNSDNPLLSDRLDLTQSPKQRQTSQDSRSSDPEVSNAAENSAPFVPTVSTPALTGDILPPEQDGPHRRYQPAQEIDPKALARGLAQLSPTALTMLSDKVAQNLRWKQRLDDERRGIV